MTRHTAGRCAGNMAGKRLNLADHELSPRILASLAAIFS
jgi:hypothetical protein